MDSYVKRNINTPTEKIIEVLPPIRTYHLIDTTNVMPDTYLRLKSCVLQVQAAYPGYKFVGFVYVPEGTVLLECAPEI